MRKATVVVVILLLSLLMPVVASFCTVKAQEEWLDVSFSNHPSTTYVNQTVEICAYVSNGTPPYSYQWYTEFIPQDMVDDPNFPFILLFPSREIVRIEVPGTGSSILNFVESTPGTYKVGLHLTDAAGGDVYAGTGPFIVVLPIHTSTPAPSPTPTPSANTVPATTDSGSTVELSISGNITSAQMANVTIATDATTTRVSFTLTGQSNTTGFGNMTIPKSAVANATTPTIYIDGQIASNQGYTQDSINYYVWYTAHFSTHQVSIVFASDSSTSLSASSVFLGLGWVQIGILVLMGIVVAVVVVVAFKTLSKKHKTN